MDYWVAVCISVFVIQLRHSETSRCSDKLDSTSWGHGLKEATYRTFVKEGWLESGLKAELHSAPIVGESQAAVPFGDVSVLARGHLCLTYGNLIFVKDKNLYDCENCETQLERRGKILTLWSVKRLRHRKPLENYRYEVEYKICPVKNGGYLKGNGQFNYDIPGHVFLLNQDIKEEHDRNDLPPFSSNYNNRHYLPPYAATTAAYYYTKRTERFTTVEKPRQRSDLQKEIELYNKLLRSLKGDQKPTATTESLFTETLRRSTTFNTEFTAENMLTTTIKPSLFTDVTRRSTTFNTEITADDASRLHQTTTTIKPSSTAFNTEFTIDDTSKLSQTSSATTKVEKTTTEFPLVTPVTSKVMMTTSKATTIVTMRPSTTKTRIPTKEDFYDIFQTRKPEKSEVTNLTREKPPSNNQVIPTVETISKKLQTMQGVGSATDSTTIFTSISSPVSPTYVTMTEKQKVVNEIINQVTPALTSNGLPSESNEKFRMDHKINSTTSVSEPVTSKQTAITSGPETPVFIEVETSPINGKMVTIEQENRTPTNYEITTSSNINATKLHDEPISDLESRDLPDSDRFIDRTTQTSTNNVSNRINAVREIKGYEPNNLNRNVSASSYERDASNSRQKIPDNVEVKAFIDRMTPTTANNISNQINMARQVKGYEPEGISVSSYEWDSLNGRKKIPDNVEVKNDKVTTPIDEESSLIHTIPSSIVKASTHEIPLTPNDTVTTPSDQKSTLIHTTSLSIVKASTLQIVLTPNDTETTPTDQESSLIHTTSSSIVKASTHESALTPNDKVTTPIHEESSLIHTISSSMSPLIKTTRCVLTTPKTRKTTRSNEKVTASPTVGSQSFPDRADRRTILKELTLVDPLNFVSEPSARMQKSSHVTPQKEAFNRKAPNFLKETSKDKQSEGKATISNLQRTSTLNRGLIQSEQLSTTTPKLQISPPIKSKQSIVSNVNRKAPNFHKETSVAGQMEGKGTVSNPQRTFTLTRGLIRSEKVSTTTPKLQMSPPIKNKQSIVSDVNLKAPVLLEITTPTVYGTPSPFSEENTSTYEPSAMTVRDLIINRVPTLIPHDTNGISSTLEQPVSPIPQMPLIPASGYNGNILKTISPPALSSPIYYETTSPSDYESTSPLVIPSLINKGKTSTGTPTTTEVSRVDITSVIEKTPSLHEMVLMGLNENRDVRTSTDDKHFSKCNEAITHYPEVTVPSYNQTALFYNTTISVRKIIVNEQANTTSSLMEVEKKKTGIKFVGNKRRKKRPRKYKGATFAVTTGKNNLSVTSKRVKTYKYTTQGKRKNYPVKPSFPRVKTTASKAVVTKRPGLNIKLKPHKQIDNPLTATTKPEPIESTLLTVPITHDPEDILGDIFGKMPKTTTTPTTTSVLTPRQNIEVDELFDQLKRKRYPKLKRKTRINGRGRKSKTTTRSSIEYTTENQSKTTINDGDRGNETTTQSPVENMTENQSKATINSGDRGNETTPQFSIEYTTENQSKTTINGNNETTTQSLIESTKYTDVESDVKIIFSNFYEASTSDTKEDVTIMIAMPETTGKNIGLLADDELTMGYDVDAEGTNETTERYDLNYNRSLRTSSTTETASLLLDNLVLSVLNNARAAKYLYKKKRNLRRRKKLIRVKGKRKDK